MLGAVEGAVLGDLLEFLGLIEAMRGVSPSIPLLPAVGLPARASPTAHIKLLRLDLSTGAQRASMGVVVREDHRCIAVREPWALPVVSPIRQPPLVTTASCPFTIFTTRSGLAQTGPWCRSLRPMSTPAGRRFSPAYAALQPLAGPSATVPPCVRPQNAIACLPTFIQLLTRRVGLPLCRDTSQASWQQQWRRTGVGHATSDTSDRYAPHDSSVRTHRQRHEFQSASRGGCRGG